MMSKIESNVHKELKHIMQQYHRIFQEDQVIFSKFCSLFLGRVNLTQAYFNEIHNPEQINCNAIIELFEDIWKIIPVRKTRQLYLIRHWLNYHISNAVKSTNVSQKEKNILMIIQENLEKTNLLTVIKKIKDNCGFSQQVSKIIQFNIQSSQIYHQVDVYMRTQKADLSLEQIQQRHKQLIYLIHTMSKAGESIQYQLQKHIIVSFEKAYQRLSYQGCESAKNLIEIDRVFDMMVAQNTMNNKIKKNIKELKRTKEEKSRQTILETIKFEITAINQFSIDKIISLSKQARLLDDETSVKDIMLKIGPISFEKSKIVQQFLEMFGQKSEQQFLQQSEMATKQPLIKVNAVQGQDNAKIVDINKIECDGVFTDPTKLIQSLGLKDKISIVIAQSKDKQYFHKVYQKIEHICQQMRQFDHLLDESNKFSSVVQAFRNSYLEEEKYVSEKIINIVSGNSINYELLENLFKDGENNPRIVKLLISKVQKIDESLYNKINVDQYLQTISLCDNFIFGYIDSVMEAYKFYNEIRKIFHQKKVNRNSFKISLQTLRQSVKSFVSNYQDLYIQIMTRISLLKFKIIPEKIQVFFRNLEEIVSNLYPQDYKSIKKSIFKMEFGNDFKIKWPSFEEKSIIERILITSNLIKKSIQEDFENTLSLSKRSSIKFYKNLSEKQQQRYLQRLRQQFDFAIAKFQQNANNGIADLENLQDFFKIMPQSTTKNQLYNQFLQIKQNIAGKKRQLQQLFTKEALNNNLAELIKIYKTMSKNEQAKYMNIIKQIISNEFKEIQNENITQKERIQCYRSLIDKYERNLTLDQQYHEIYKQLKKKLQNQISNQIKNLISDNKLIFQIHDYNMIRQVLKNHQIIINAYMTFVEENNCLPLLDDVEDYFEAIISEFQNEELRKKSSIPNIYNCEVQNIQQYIRNKQYFSQIIKETYKISKDKDLILKSRLNQLQIKSIFRFIEEEYKQNNQLQILANEITQVHRQVSSFTFSQFIAKSSLQTNIQQKSRQFLQQLSKKIHFLLKIQPIYSQHNLSKFKMGNNKVSISNLDSFKIHLNSQLVEAFKQIQNLQNHLENQLSIRFNLIAGVYQLWKNNAKNPKDPRYFIRKIINGIIIGVGDIILRFQGQIKQFIEKLSKSSSNLSQNPNNIQKANNIITTLIILQKMQNKISFQQDQIKKATLKMVELIQNIPILLKLIVQQMKKRVKNQQITIIIQKYKQFRSVLQGQFNQKSQEYIDQLLYQLKQKNPHLKVDVASLMQDYISCKNSLDTCILRYTENSSQESINAISKDIQGSLLKQGKSLTIGKIFALYFILKGKQTGQVSFKPHPTQIIAIFLLLQNIESLNGIRNNIVQMFPGQGKSILLACTACILALKGFKVFQICQSKYIVQRDHEQFKQLFQILQINHLIKYNILGQLCREAVNKYLKQLVEEKDPQNIILMDQIDCLFSEEFQGEIYEPLKSLTDEGQSYEIKGIFEYIYNTSRTQYLTIQSMENVKQLSILIQKYSNLSTIIKGQVQIMLRDVYNQGRIQQHCEIIQNDKNGLLSSNDFVGYEECFAYLKLKEKGLVNEKIVKNKLKISFKIGQFSYCQIPKYFGKIIGVSGRLKCFSETHKKILNNQYKIDFFYYIAPNNLACATRQFARGFDDKDYALSEGPYAIQTCLPESLEQTKGRIARAGKSGQYKLMTSSEQIKDIVNGEDRTNKRQAAMKRHKQTLNSYIQGTQQQLYQIINTFSPENKKQILIVFGFQGNIKDIQQYKKWLIDLLQIYESWIKKYQFNIKLKYQVCYYKSYEDYSPISPIFTTTKICQITELKQSLKHRQTASRYINQTESTELFFKHILDLSEKEKVSLCFVWSRYMSDEWQTFKLTPQFKKYELQIKRQLNIKQDMKKCQQYLKTIKEKEISMSFIGLNPSFQFKKKIQKYSIFQGKESLIHKDTNDLKRLGLFFFERMKKTIPQFRLKQILSQIVK